MCSLFMCLLHGLPVRVSLEAERRDEDVDEDREEDKDRCYVVHLVQLGVFPYIIQVIFHWWHTHAQQQKK